MHPYLKFVFAGALVLCIACATTACAQPSPVSAVLVSVEVADAGHTLAADRAYYAMVNGALEKWDFLRDGTFLHEGVAAGVGTGVRTSERGTYRIQGNLITLHIGKTASAFAAARSIGGGADSSTRIVQLKIQLLGADGSDGVVLNGQTFHIRHGW